MRFSELNFEWDPLKARANMQKHGVSFERAASVFEDPEAVTVFDPEHSSHGEERWITIGLDSRGILVVVCHTWRENEPVQSRCRIFSARKATAREIRLYRGE